MRTDCPEPVEGPAGLPKSPATFTHWGAGGTYNARGLLPSDHTPRLMRKNFILDTNVLLHDPRAIFAFDDNNVVIPIYVIEEIDQFKRDLSELGRNARQVARYLDEFRAEGTLARGRAARRGGGDAARASSPSASCPRRMAQRHRRPTTASWRWRSTSQRARAGRPGDLRHQGHQPAHPRRRPGAHRRGLRRRAGRDQRALHRRAGGARSPPSGRRVLPARASSPLDRRRAFAPNEFVLLKDRDNPQHTAMGKFSADRGRRRAAHRASARRASGASGRATRSRRFALDLLLNDEIKLVTLVGKAGTGKTLLAIAAGLHKTMEESVYQKLLVSPAHLPARARHRLPARATSRRSSTPGCSPSSTTSSS